MIRVLMTVCFIERKFMAWESDQGQVEVNWQKNGLFTFSQFLLEHRIAPSFVIKIYAISDETDGCCPSSNS